MNWIRILIICCIFVPIMNRIEREIRKKYHNKFGAFIIIFIIALVILLALYGIFYLFGFPAFEK